MSDLQVQIENLMEKRLSVDKHGDLRLLQEVGRIFPDYTEQMMFVLDYVSSCVAHRKAGWLPYYPWTFDIARNYENDINHLDTKLSQFYRAKWGLIRDEILGKLEIYDIEQEAKSALREALVAHDQKLYRCVCRLLPTEIERLVRHQKNLDQWEKIKTADIQNEMFKDITKEDLFTLNPHGVEYFIYAAGYFYAPVSPQNLQKFKNLYQNIPNRHASLHGNITYSTFKNSVNMILLTYATFTFFHEKRRQKN